MKGIKDVERGMEDLNKEFNTKNILELLQIIKARGKTWKENMDNINKNKETIDSLISAQAAIKSKFGGVLMRQVTMKKDNLFAKMSKPENTNVVAAHMAETEMTKLDAVKPQTTNGNLHASMPETQNINAHSDMVLTTARRTNEDEAEQPDTGRQTNEDEVEWPDTARRTNENQALVEKAAESPLVGQQNPHADALPKELEYSNDIGPEDDEVMNMTSQDVKREIKLPENQNLNIK